MEEINLFDLKSLYGKRVTQGQEANMHRWKGGLNSYSNPKKLRNVFIALHICFIAKGRLYLLFLSELLLIPFCILTLAAKPPTILYLFILIQQAVVPRCAHRSCFCSVIVRCSTHNCIMEKQPPTKSKQDKPMTPA